MNLTNKDLLLALRECGGQRIALGRYATGEHYFQTARSFARRAIRSAGMPRL